MYVKEGWKYKMMMQMALSINPKNNNNLMILMRKKQKRIN
jgi:hypothetical protein